MLNFNFSEKDLAQSDCNWTRTHNHLVHKRTLNHLANLALVSPPHLVYDF